VDVNLPDLPSTGTDSAQTTLSNTTLEDTTIGQSEPAPTATVQKTQPSPNSAAPTIQRLQELNRCTTAANGDLDKITTCFDRFNSGQ
jgi:hypothetical protein